MKIKIAMLLIVLAFCFTGCYDNNEIDSLANVTAVGIEEDGFTFAIADTGSFSGEGEKGSESSVICRFSEHNDIENAIEDVNREISKKMSFSHLSAIIVSENMAKKGVYDTIDYFEGMPDVRPQTLVAVSYEKPSLYLNNLNPAFEVNTEKYFLNLFQKGSSYIPVLRMSDYTNSVKSNTDALAPFIANDEIKTVVISGGKLSSEIEDEAVLGLLNSTKNVSVEYKNKNYILRSVSLPKIKADCKEDNLHISIYLHLSDKNGDFNDAEFIEEKVKSYLMKMSQKNLDVFGFYDSVKEEFFSFREYEKYISKHTMADCKYSVYAELSDGK